MHLDAQKINVSKITNLKRITIRFDEESITYFKAISEEVGIPYQSLINLYLRDCAATNRKLNLNWTTPQS